MSIVLAYMNTGSSVNDLIGTVLALSGGKKAGAH